MRLYLVRHGEASMESSITDPELSSRGEMEVESLADFFSQAELSVSYILHSGKRRAQQTATILATAIANQEVIAKHAGLCPNDSVLPIAKQCDQWENDTMLVGHLPFMQRLANLLLLHEEESDFLLFRTATVLCLEKTEGRWHLAWMIGPEL